MTHLTEHLEQLITERHDGNLTAAELAEVERTIAANADAAELARQYHRLSMLLAGFRVLPPGIDYLNFRRTVSDQITEESAFHASIGADAAHDPAVAAASDKPGGPHFDPLKQQFEQLDELVGEAFRPLPPVDWDTFRDRVATAVNAETAADQRRGANSFSGSVRHARRLRWILRAAVPLAAAAVLLIVLRQGGIESPPASSEMTPKPTFVSIAVDRPQPTGRVSITFDRSAPPAEAAAGNDKGGIIIATTGAVAPSNDAVELALLF